MSKYVGLVSLGCPKNQVDAELMLAKLQQNGYDITADPLQAQLVIINTCGFIEDAKREAIETILEFAQLKQEGKIAGLIVTGCLGERYRDEVRLEMPEIDAVIGIGCNEDIVEICDRVLQGDRMDRFADKDRLPLNGDRLLTTPPHYAYLKIADGCDNRCAYCAIPAIRGGYRSRTMADIVQEAETLAARGVQELILIAQDTTAYGLDLDHTHLLPALLEKLSAIEGIRWLRLLYCYPEHITDDLLQIMRDNPKVLHYIDLPLQHAHADILRRMHRKGSRETLTALIEKIRRYLPDVCLRTTVMTGFPGESESEFEELCGFIQEIRFDRLGCFAYSPEEGTPAASFEHQIPSEVKKQRQEHIMQEQFFILQSQNQALLNQTLLALVEGYDEPTGRYRARTYRDAPEIDCTLYFTSEQPYKAGDFVSVTIQEAGTYDLAGVANPDTHSAIGREASK